jgi:hypothetical protein
VRPLDSWKRSFRKFFAHQYGEELQLPRKTGVPVAHFWYGRLQETIHQTLYFSHATLDDAYNAFEDRVTRFFADKPSERFLRLNLFAGDSWPKLCGFLGVPVPDVPFPWENRFASPQKG